MTAYIVKRLLGIIPVLFGVALLIFTLNRVVPSNPAVAILGDKGSVEEQQRLADELGLNRPLFLNWQKFRGDQDLRALFDSQYFEYMGGLVRGDLGKSFFTRTPVTAAFAKRFPATVELAIVSIAIAIVFGIVLGIFAALNRNNWIDTVLSVIALSGVSFPVFWTAIILVYLFSIQFPVLPPAGRLPVTSYLEPITGLFTVDALLRGEPKLALEALKHLILPGIALGTSAMARMMRMTRSSVLEVIGQDYIRTAQSKGLSQTAVIMKHTLRNALLPVITVIGLSFGSLLSGTILIEAIFNWPGVGSWVYEAISMRDYPVIQGGVLFIGAIFVFLNALVDLSYAIIDPRIGY